MHIVLRMNYDRLLLIDAVVFFIYSIGTLIFARELLDLHGIQLDTSGVLMADIAAAAFFAFSVLNLKARKLSDVNALHAIMDANLIKHIISLIVFVSSFMSGGLDDIRTLSFVLLFFVFSVAYGFYYFSKEEYVSAD